jgi:hypothetical protein
MNLLIEIAIKTSIMLLGGCEVLRVPTKARPRP